MPTTVLETDRLSKRFHSRKAVDNLSLHVFDGDVYGFLGPNGAGKSTTIRLITGLIHASEGTARVMNLDISRERVKALRHIGALVESPAFYKYLSAHDNLEILARLSGQCDDHRIDEVLETVGLADRAKDKVKTYSHGMNQRLGIAATLLSSPKVIILDEPTNGLDPQGMRDVRELILRLSHEERITVFLSSHLLHEVQQVCSRVGIINRGKLIAEGSVDELLNVHGSGIVEIVPGDKKVALQVLKKLDAVEILPDTNSSNGGILIRSASDIVPEINRALVAANVDVYSISPKPETLENLFFELIGEDAHEI